MIKKLVLFLISIVSLPVFAQKNVNIPLANDFTIISTHNDTLNLYKTLAEGKTVVLDLFQVTCGPCQTNTPIIDSAFGLHGSGQQNVVFWGVSNADSNNVINQFINNYQVKFPCAGIEGMGESLINLLQSQMGIFGFPAYAVICPFDKTMHWQVYNPPTVNGFDQYINICNSTKVNNQKPKEEKIVSLFPNPATEYVNVKINTQESAKYRIELLNNMGEKIKSNIYLKEKFDNNFFKVDLDELNEGSYYITVYQDGNLIFAGLIMKINQN